MLLTLVLGGLFWQRNRVEAALAARSLPWITLFFVAFRLVPFLGTYVVLGYEPQSDVKEYFYRIASSALRLEVPYRDVYSPYSPFFGYLLAIPLAVYNNVRVIVLTFLVLETATVWLTQRLFLPAMPRGERLFRCLVYYLLPVSFVFSVFSGQEDVLAWGLSVGAIWVWHQRQNAFVGGVLLGLGLLSTKATFVLLLIPVFLITSRKISFVAGAAAVGLPVLAWLYRTGGTLFLEQPLDEGDYLKAPNWRSVLNPLLSGPVAVNGNVGKWITLALLLLIIAAVTRQVRRKEALIEYFPMVYIAVFAAMSVLQQNAISVYAYAFMLPLVFCLTNFRNRTEVIILLVFNLLAANHPSIWWRMGQPYHTFGALGQWPNLAEYTMEWLILAGFGWCFWLAIRQLQRGPVPTLTPPA